MERERRSAQTHLLPEADVRRCFVCLYLDPVETLSTDTDCSLVESDLMFDVNGVRDTQTDSIVPEVDRERSKLEERVRELEELLCEAHRECERNNKDGERAEEAYSILQSQYEETLKQRDELLMVSLPEAERKYKQAMKTNAQLEKEKSKLMSRVDTLQGSMQQLGHLLCETRTECIEAKRVVLTDESSSQVEDENSSLRSDVETLQDSVQELDRELAVSRITCKELTRECDGAKQQLRILQSECSEMKDILLKDCERVPEVHRMLMSQNELLKKLLKQNEELMQASPDEAESKYEKTVMTNAELENKNSDLMSLVTTLQGTVEVMEKKLAETCRKCDDIRRSLPKYKINKVLHLHRTSGKIRTCHQQNGALWLIKIRLKSMPSVECSSLTFSFVGTM
ncbi:M protein, serotype 2.1-like [Tachysurus vachellii]|uniref:M protein, serotype 2.1-like n=1 Tax=Tachysurus vachellii TaxID=175792 RepID=UPI00296AF3EE|nr:M protein, serotype 2.1-like [Tachysurus vachellii]